MPDRYFRLIGKYALILAAFLVIEYSYSEFLIDKIFNTQDSPYIKAVSPTALKLLLNIAMALLINLDARKLRITTQYITLVTILSKHVGVVAFLLFAIFEKEKLDS